MRPTSVNGISRMIWRKINGRRPVPQWMWDDLCAAGGNREHIERMVVDKTTRPHKFHNNMVKDHGNISGFRAANRGRTLTGDELEARKTELQ